MNMSSTTVSILLTILSALSLHAAQLHVLAWDQAIAKRDLAITSGGKEAKSEPILSMHHLARSAPVKISTKSQSIQLQVNDRLSEDGKPLLVPIEIPEGVTRPLIIIISNKESPTGLKAMVINDDDSDFKWGTIRFVNVTGSTLVFRTEKKNTLLKSSWKPITVSPGGNTRNMGVAFYLRSNPKLPPLYSSIWKHRDDLRQLVFIVPSKDKSRSVVDFKFLTENRAVVEAPKKTQ